jgi:serine aminopeptidase S33 family
VPRKASKNSTNVRTRIAALRPAVFGALERTAPGAAGWWADRMFFTPPRPALAPRLEALLASATRFDVPWAAGALPAWRWGDGPRVLLVHGWGSRAGHLAAFVDPLVQAGFAPVAFDGPAHGLSPGRRTNVPEMARALAAVAKATGPVHAVVAHSVGAAVTALALREGLGAGRAVFLAPAGDPEGFTRTFAARLGLGPASLRAMRRRAERRIGVPFAAINVLALARGQRAPLLVVHDRDDEEVACLDGLALAEAWAGAEVLVTRGLGHRRVLKDGAVVARALAFVAEGGQPPRGCGHPGAGAGAPGLCPSCALDQHLFARDTRWPRAEAELG